MWDKKEYRGMVIGVDIAEDGGDYSVFKCPVCKTFQELVNSNYLCKDCARLKLEEVILFANNR
jgi:hypothetical protein